ncbi:hypothetical protein RNI15_34070, partial [Pseudomonas aeruginosa]|nr:hypothetical protein [Pseudomonas aeruginosa]
THQFCSSLYCVPVLGMNCHRPEAWDRMRRGFSIPNLHTDLVDYWTNYYASHPESIRTMSQRASRYLYPIMDELDARGLP